MSVSLRSLNLRFARRASRRNPPCCEFCLTAQSLPRKPSLTSHCNPSIVASHCRPYLASSPLPHIAYFISLPSFAQQPFPYLTPHTLPHITFLASHAKPCFSPHALPPTPSLTPHYVPCLATLALPHTPNLTYPKTLPHTNPITFPPQKSLTHARPPAEVL